MQQYHSEAHNAYYHQLIKRFQPHIIASIISLILLAVCYEGYASYQKSMLNDAQNIFESFLQDHNPKHIQYLKQKHPSKIHAHLAALSEAKTQFLAKEYENCIETLEWILAQNPDTAVAEITKTRLVNVYIETHQNERANAIAAEVKNPMIQLVTAYHENDLTQLPLDSDDPQVQLLMQYLQFKEAL